jgi:predicted AAA+ superfamily ATPase
LVDGLTKKYLFLRDNNKFRVNEKPVEFFDSIDLSDKNYFKYKKKKYQNILIHGIKGNGKTFGIEWFAEKFCEYHKCKAVYIVMPDFIEVLYSLDFKEKRLYIENILKKYKLICIDEIHRFKINEHIHITMMKFIGLKLTSIFI